jgi:hypothetical protein
MPRRAKEQTRFRTKKVWNMPKGPKSRKSPIDAISIGMRVDAGVEQVDFPPDDGKNKAAQWLGQRGGKARAKALSPERRRAIAKKAAKSRWG